MEKIADRLVATLTAACSQIPERRTVRYRNKGTPIQYRYRTDKMDAGIPMLAASAVSLDPDAQQWISSNLFFSTY
jgi:hypothetical protein